MILLSSIVKAKYVLIEDKEINKEVNKEKNKEINKTTYNQISETKEELYEIYNQREYIINDAKEEAAKIINAAKRNAVSEISESKKRAFEEGYNSGLEIGKSKGFDEGYEEGNIKAEEEHNKGINIKLKEIKDMIRIIENEKQSIISKYENEIETLAINIAEKIIRQKIDLKDNMVPSIIESVVKEFKNVEWVKIYISDKDDINAVYADRTLIEELQKVTNDVKIEVSKELVEGSCVVETPDSIIDAGIDTQLNNLKEILLNK